MTLVTGTVQDLGYDGMEGTLWARPARFRSDGQVVLAPERKPFKITGGVVSADLAPGPAVIELQVGSHARDTFEVVIPEGDTTLADLLDSVFVWEPAQIAEFERLREAAEAAAGQATTAAQQARQDRSHVDQVRTELDEAFDESTAGNVLPPRLTEAALNAAYAGQVEAAVDAGVVARNIAAPVGHLTGQRPLTMRRFLIGATAQVTYTNGVGTAKAVSEAKLTVTLTVPESRRIDYTFNGTASVPAGATYKWCVMIDDKPVEDTITTICTAPAGEDTTPQLFTLSGDVIKDGDGALLEAGRTVKFQWGHLTDNGVWAPMHFGPGNGSPMMEVTPASSRLGERAVNEWITGPNDGNFLPLWMCHDRIEILGVPGDGSWNVAWSGDEGRNWSVHSFGFPRNIQHIRQLDNGEIAVFVARQVDNTPPSIWLSSGWPTNHATATFTKVHQWLPRTAGSWHSWSMDAFGPLILAAEYGPKNSAEDMGRYVYISEDYGQTWRICFDLTTVPGFDATDGSGWHVHGVCYDPWWDAIWVCTGDGTPDGTVIPYTLVSYDRGETWTVAHKGHQFTSMYAMPSGILMFTDYGNPNGVYRINRDNKHAPSGEWAYIADPAEQLTIYGTQMFRSRAMPDAPLLMATQTANPVGAGRLIATYDGCNFTEVWRDSSTYANAGLRTMVGPTISGRYLGRLDRNSASAQSAALSLRIMIE